MNQISIENRPIGPGHPTYVIAEIGFNHGGDLDLAVEMIEAAARSGVDAVKFQTFNASGLVLESAEHFGVIKDAELSLDDHLKLSLAAKDNNVAFLSTPFDLQSMDLLEKVGVPAFKVASMDVDNLPMLARIAGLGKPILLSTGMATIEEITDAVNTIKDLGNDRIVLLHCVSKYPTPENMANLRTITQLQDAFGLSVGYSDHVLGNEAALAAATLGASVIEKHFTSDKQLPGPDHAMSADPAQMAELVGSIRKMETCMGKAVADENRPDRPEASLFRRSLHAGTAISAGTVITAEMIKCVRPGNGLRPNDIDKVLGKAAKNDIPNEAPITMGDV